MNIRSIKTMLKIIPFITAILMVINIVFTNHLVAYGKDVHVVDQNIEYLQSENENLDQEVASASSLLTISQKAMELGFTEPAKSQYISVSPETLPVALGHPQ